MATLTGMDIQAVRQLAKDLRTGSTDIDSLIKRLTTKIDGALWVGPDYTKFKQDWHSTHVPSLRKVSDALKEVATTADRNANEQEKASGN